MFQKLLKNKYGDKFDENRYYFSESDIVQLTDNQTLVIVTKSLLFQQECIVIKNGFYYKEKGFQVIPIDKFPYYNKNNYLDFNLNFNKIIKRGLNINNGDIIYIDGHENRIGIFKEVVNKTNDYIEGYLYVLDKNKLNIENENEDDFHFHKTYDNTYIWYRHKIYNNNVLRWEI